MMKLSRRRFLGHVLGAGLVSAAAYSTYRGFVPGYPKIRLDYPGMDLGHAMRDALIKRPVNICEHIEAFPATNSIPIWIQLYLFI